MEPAGTLSKETEFMGCSPDTLGQICDLTPQDLYPPKAFSQGGPVSPNSALQVPDVEGLTHPPA